MITTFPIFFEKKQLLPRILRDSEAFKADSSNFKMHFHVEDSREKKTSGSWLSLHTRGDQVGCTFHHAAQGTCLKMIEVIC